MELIGVKPRKAQYLVFIADRLEKLPVIAAAFNAGELPWTKAREIVRVATLETEQEWLEKAKKLSNRELEKTVRKHEGTGSGEFVTLTISMPVELLSVWHDTYELAERVSGGELEKWQVLEPDLAEFMSTYLAAAEENQRALFGDRRREGSFVRSERRGRGTTEMSSMRGVRSSWLSSASGDHGGAAPANTCSLRPASMTQQPGAQIALRRTVDAIKCSRNGSDEPRARYEASPLRRRRADRCRRYGSRLSRARYEARP